MSNKEYKVYLRSENRFVDVPEAFYYAYYRPLWAQMQKLQRSGECVCPQKKLCYCDGDCLVCDYHLSRTCSLDEPFDETGVCLNEAVFSSENIEKTIETDELMSLLKKELSKLSERDNLVCQMICEDATFSEIAKKLNVSVSTAHYYVERAKKHLKESLLFIIMGEEGDDLDD